MRGSGIAKIGSCIICRNTKIVMAGGNLTIGDGTMIGEKAVINVFADVSIGKNVVTADNVSYITNNKIYADINMPIQAQTGAQHESILVGEWSWIGINATLLPGTVIGKNSVVGANSVVKGVFPDYCVIAGVPAKIVKKYSFDSKKWERVKIN